MERLSALCLHYRETDQRSETVRARDSRKIEFFRRLSYYSQLGNSRRRIIPIDLESDLFGIRPRDVRHRAKYLA